MNILVLEEQLVSAQASLKKLLASKAKTVRDSMAAIEAVASAQRALAAAKGEEYAIPHDIGFHPDAGVSEPVLLQSDYAAVLTFSAKTKALVRSWLWDRRV